MSCSRVVLEVSGGHIKDCIQLCKLLALMILNRAELKKLALFEDNSSGEKIRKVEGFFLITSVRYVPMAFI